MVFEIIIDVVDITFYCFVRSGCDLDQDGLFIVSSASSEFLREFYGAYIIRTEIELVPVDATSNRTFYPV